MTYNPRDCPNSPQVCEPDALSFLGGGGSGVALREARGLHRTAKLLELERRDAPLLRLHSLFPRERTGWPWRRGGHGQDRTRFTSPTVGVERKPYFTCK